MRHETGRAGQATGMAAAGAFDGPIGIAGPGNAGSCPGQYGSGYGRCRCEVRGPCAYVPLCGTGKLTISRSCDAYRPGVS
jgi:hypothetical protein